MRKPFILLLMLLGALQTSFSQIQGQSKIDSLLSELVTAKDDSNKVNTLNILCSENNNIGEYIEARKLVDEALIISEKIGYKKGVGNAYRNIGNIYYYQSNFPEALRNYISSLKIFEVLKDKRGISNAYGNIGIIYTEQGNYNEALKNFFLSLNIRELIGIVKDKAGVLNDIGLVYSYQKKYKDALGYYSMAMEINKKYGNQTWLSANLNNIGESYKKQNMYPEALKYYLEALNLAEEIGDKNGIANLYINIGMLYRMENTFMEAMKYEKKGLSLALEIGALEWIKEGYKELATIDSAMNNFQSAFEYNKLYMKINDSIFNMEKYKKLTSLQMTYDFDKKESSIKAEQEKKDVIDQKELQKQKLVRNGFIGGFAIVLFFAGIFFRQRNKIRKEKLRSDEILLNILPAEVAEELKAKGNSDAKQFDEVTVMFTGFKNFTQVSEKLLPSDLVSEIHTCFKAFDNITAKYNIEKIKTIGDSYMCAGGLPVTNKTNATDVVSAAMEIQRFMHEHLKQKIKDGKEPFEMRIGIHSGVVVAGIVGSNKFAYDIWGDTVNIASRIESSGEPGKINISGSTFMQVKDKFNCIYRGKIKAKNKGEIDMYFVE